MAGTQTLSEALSSEFESSVWILIRWKPAVFLGIARKPRSPANAVATRSAPSAILQVTVLSSLIAAEQRRRVAQKLF